MPLQIWQAQHENELNFVDPDEAPDSKVFVTTRFARLLPGYVEVALGLLSETEAVTLLLGAAHIETPTVSQAEASKAIVKMAGMLPLYCSMLGHLIFELKDSSVQPWEVEVVALLEEEKMSVLGHDSVGDLIVGASVSQISDPDARALFSAIGVAAEDVRIPLAALELIWCASKGQTPPLGRLGMIKLRRWCFQLLDRNLLLGETSHDGGVYFHDIVREYSRASVDAKTLRHWQRAMVDLIIAAAPNRGWGRASNGPLNRYVLQSLRWHMSDGTSGVSVAADVDAQVLRWLENKDRSIADNFVLMSAANALGAELVLQLADEALAAGDTFVAGTRMACAGFTDSSGALFVARLAGNATLDAVERQLQIFLRAAALCEEGADPCNLFQRTVELGIRVAVSGKFGNESAIKEACGANARRIGVLLDPPGVMEPDTAESSAMLGFSMIALALPALGAMVTGAGNHLDPASVRQGHGYMVKVSRLSLGAIMRADPEDVLRQIIPGGAAMFHSSATSVWCDGFDAGELFPVAFLRDVVVRYDWERVNDDSIKMNAWGQNAMTFVPPTNALMLRWGELGLGRMWYEKFLAVHEPGRPWELGPDGIPVDPRKRYDVAVGTCFGNFSTNAVVAGLGDVLLRVQALCYANDFDGVDAAFALWMDSVYTQFQWSADKPIRVTLHEAATLQRCQKLVLLLAALQCDPDGDLASNGKRWMPETPGAIAASSNGYDLKTGANMDENAVMFGEAWAYELLGRPSAALEAAAIRTERFPACQTAETWDTGVAGRCMLMMGQPDAGRAKLASAIDTAARCNVPLVEMLLCRDLAAAG